MKIEIELSYAQATAIVAFADRIAATPAYDLMHLQQAVGIIKTSIRAAAIAAAPGQPDPRLDDAVREFHDGPPEGQS
jgi:HEAT repeat protein